MKAKFELEPCEQATLFQMSVNHPWKDARLRATGLLLLDGEKDFRVVAQRCGVTFQTVYNWRNAWEKRGLRGLMRGHVGGRPEKLTADWIETSLTIAREEALSLREIMLRAEAIHGSPFPSSKFRLSAALRRNGFSFKRTRWSLKKSGMPSTLLPARKNSTD